jgi:acyl-CoA reductase-like NAD-dependent aldehyde dehydrogenase
VENKDEAIKIANDTEYGLSSAVFTKDLARGLRLVKRTESGAVHINAMSVHDEPGLPHGGVKSSGLEDLEAMELSGQGRRLSHTRIEGFLWNLER